MPLDTTLASKLAEPYILALLEREPTHPYGLMKSMEEVFDQPPGKGRIYQLMKRLEADGLVESKAEAGRGLYSLTKAGGDALAAYRTKPLKFYDFLEELWGMQKPVTIGHRAKGAEPPAIAGEAGRGLEGFRGAAKVSVTRDFAQDRLVVTVDGLDALVADRVRTARLLAALELIAGTTLPG